MKILVLVLLALLTITSVIAEPVYRPYATCISPNQHTHIEIMQNTDAKGTANPFDISIVHNIRGNKVSMMNQNAIRVPVLHKDILEMFQSFGSNPAYGFELVISKFSPPSMMGQFKGYYIDMLGRSVVYCSHHVTFGN